VSTRTTLEPPSADAPRAAWPLRAADVDLHGHVNNAVYWQAVEERLGGGGPDPRQPLRAWLDYREPLDLGDELELAIAGDAARVAVGFLAAGSLRAVALVEPLA
jgi:acyl-ACP thioesterase